MVGAIIGGVIGIAVLVVLIQSIYYIGPIELGLVIKRVGRRLPEDNPIAFEGEAGYQADLLYPGLRIKLWPIWKVIKYPWVQVPAGEIGVVVAQVGRPLPVGAKSAEYNEGFGMFQSLGRFMESGGQKGVQRPVLPPGMLAPMHPVAFLVITKGQVYGRPVSPDIIARAGERGYLTAEDFGLKPKQLEVTMIEPEATYPELRGREYTAVEEEVKVRTGKVRDMIGIITALEGQPLKRGDIASRIGGWADLEALEARGAPISEMIETILGAKNTEHNNYQDFQEFLNKEGRIGLQHDPLLYGAFNLNPFLISAEMAPMLTVEQGEVAVIKSYVGKPTEDTSGEGFKYGSLVRPGYKGIWQESLRTGKYPINPHTYEAVIVPTYILTLNWAEQVSEAHRLDERLTPIEAKSREGFVFKIDLQVQIHIPDTMAPRVISKVGTMENLVNEVLQAAVGNHFRDRLQSMPAIRFIETRQQVQEDAFEHISAKLAEYEVETIGVYIQDVVFPERMVEVLTSREIANQEQEMYKMQEAAQKQKLEMEQTAGRADKQRALAESHVEIQRRKNIAAARIAEAEGEATYIKETGKAQAAEVRAVGLARAEAYQKQVAALGQGGTTLVNVTTHLSEGRQKFVPDIMVTGGGSMDGLAGALMGAIKSMGQPPPEKVIEGEKVDYEAEPGYMKREEPSAEVKELLKGAPKEELTGPPEKEEPAEKEPEEHKEGAQGEVEEGGAAKAAVTFKEKRKKGDW